MFVVPVERRKVNVGQRFGRLAIVGVPFYMQAGKKRTHGVVCECECGEAKIVGVDNILRGVTTSCGCWHREKAAIDVCKHNRKHGFSESAIYRAWHGMKGRCFNANDAGYVRYGARGITVCQEWWSFQPFLEWSQANGYMEGLTIDRIDNNGPYAPWNCRWATQQQQANNRRGCNMLAAFGETKSLSQWLLDSRCAVSESMLRRRLKMGWTAQEAITNQRDSVA